MSKEATDLRTDLQVKRSHRDADICKRYTALRAEQPLVTRNRVLLTVAKEYGLVGMTIKGILRKNGAYI